MAKNRVLERLLLALFDLLGKTREKYLQTEERKQKSLQGHQEILDCHQEWQRSCRPAGHAPPFRGRGGCLVQEKKGGGKRRSFSRGSVLYNIEDSDLTDQFD